jgi:serine/threonine protein kinase
MGCGASTIAPTVSTGLGQQDFVFSYIIGKGGFGKVYSAMHSESKTWLAVKEQKLYRVLSHKNGLVLIHSELQALKTVGKHNFIVSLAFAFTDASGFYMALDLCIGGDLRYHLKREEICSERQVAFIAMCLSSALNHIHSCGVLHRDVKPENVIYDEHGFPYLTDFGVAFNSGVSGSSTSILCTMSSGTRQYIAPELFASRHEHSCPADFWSLGVMCYELLYRKRPFVKHCPRLFMEFAESQQAERDMTASSKRKRCGPLQAAACHQSTPIAIVPVHQTSNACDHNAQTEVECFACAVDEEEASPCLEAVGIPLEHPSSPYDPEVPTYLRTHIPDVACLRCQVSSSCKRVLARLLDVRPTHRFGYASLRRDCWFSEQLWDWAKVEVKAVTPPFTPDLKVVSMDVCSKFLFDTESSDAAVADVVGHQQYGLPTTEAAALIDDFRFVAEQYVITAPSCEGNQAVPSSPSGKVAAPTYSDSDSSRDDAAVVSCLSPASPHHQLVYNSHLRQYVVA